MIIIKASKLVKKYKQLLALDGIDLEVEEGECFGILGPNGAGKTTFIRTVMAMSPLDSGQLLVAGQDVSKNGREIKAFMSLAPQADNLDPDLTVLQNLLTYARYYDIPPSIAKKRAMENLNFMNLLEKQKARIDELSGGMKRRLIIARALMNEPRIILLDEPTTGLDPQTKYMVWHRMVLLKERGITQILCTQNMEEAAYLCGRLIIMNEGKIITQGTPGELIYRHTGKQMVEIRPSAVKKEELLSLLKSKNLTWQVIESSYRIYNPRPDDFDTNYLLTLGEVSFRAPTLEDVFLKLTGRTLTD